MGHGVGRSAQSNGLVRCRQNSSAGLGTTEAFFDFVHTRTAGHRTRTQGRGHGTRSRSDALARAGASTAIDAGRAVDACTGEGRAAARPRGLECVEYFIKPVKYMSV